MITKRHDAGAGRRMVHAANLLALSVCLPADAQVYNYVDRNTGYKVFSTLSAPPLDAPLPAPAKPAPKSEARQAVPQPTPLALPRKTARAPAPQRTTPGLIRTAVPATSFPRKNADPPRRRPHLALAVFPQVSREEQRERDTERRRIIEEELRNEEELLARALERNAASDILRLGGNIGALRRELASIR